MINYLSAILTARRQKKVLDAKDSRMRIITEAINSIKIIKLNSWIDKFLEKIRKSRNHEIWMLKTRFFVSCLNIFLIFLLPPLLALTVFSVAIHSGIEMRVSTAFAALHVLNMLREPTRWLPFFLGMMMEFTVSMKRIQKFLNAEEIHPGLIQEKPMIGALTAISVNDSNFSWGGEKINKDDEDDKKKGKDGKEKGSPKLNGKQTEKQPEKQSSHSYPKYVAINEDGSDDEESKQGLDVTQTTDSVSESEGDSETDKPHKIRDLINLKSIGLEVEQGEFICIIGEVGSGKSSLISSLLGDLLYVSHDTIQEVRHSIRSAQVFKLVENFISLVRI